MTDELKPPKTIYLQWDADPLAENTWSEDRINDDDVEYTRSDMGKPAEIIALKSLIERLVEVGAKACRDYEGFGYGIDNMFLTDIYIKPKGFPLEFSQDEFKDIASEWQAMKGGVDFSKVPEVILPDELKLYNQEGE